MQKIQQKTFFKKKATFEPIYLGGKVIHAKNSAHLFSPLNSEICVFNTDSGEIEFKIAGDGEKVTSMVLDKSEKVLVLATSAFLVHVWSIQDNREIRSFKAHDGPITCMDIDVSNSLIATGSADSFVKVWDLERGYCTHNFKGHKGIVNYVKFHDESHHELYSCAADNSIRIWNLMTKQCSAVLENHTSSIQSFAFSSDFEYLFSGGRDNIINKWSLKTKKLIQTIPTFETIESVDVITSNSHDLIVSGGGKGVIKLWDSLSGKELKTSNIQYSISSLAFMKEQSEIMVLTSDQNILFYDLSLNRKRQLVGFNDEVTDLSFFGNSKLFLSSNSEQIRVLDLEKKDWSILYGHSEIVLCMAVDVKNRIMISGSKDNTARIWTWNLEETIFSCIAQCVGHVEAVGAVAICPTGNSFVTGSQDRTIKFWDYDFDNEKNKALVSVKYTKTAHEKDLNSLAFSHDGKYFASASQDKTVKIWNLEGEVKGTLKGHKRGVWSVQFSPCDPCIVTSSGDRTIKLWSTNDFSCLKTFEGHTNSVLRVSFFNNGAQLASTSSDGLVKIWTIKNNECVANLDNHTDKIWALAVQNGPECVLASAGADSLINIWVDCTSEEEEKEFLKKEELTKKEQELSNYLTNNDYKNALYLAMELDQPSKLYFLFKSIIDRNHVGCDDFIKNLNAASLNKLLLYIRDWNSQSKKSMISQKILNSILKLKTAEELLDLENSKDIISSLLPYTERHLKKLDELMVESYILDFSLIQMK